MCRLNYGTLLLIAASFYVAICSHAKPMQSAQKLDLPNRIRGGPGGGTAAHSTVLSEARQKRAMGEYKELNDIIDELEENNLQAQKSLAMASPLSTAQLQQQPQQEYDLDNMPPLTYYLLLQKLRQLQNSNEPAYRVRTPRLGRSIDFQQLLDASGVGDEEMSVGGGGGGGLGIQSRQFVSRMMKKSVPFKPRLGKRAQVCGGSSSSD
ncbi:protein hugin [Scaptodrosophila lebanonensis]|uniref:Protein hugin n=1 Tax=Drosophila lebanonensis TaxID=7225 RepID=A0A6J2SZW5_DROLE|nr:protein hugin [Scaptodrosophila lebanonensis]